MSFTDAESPQDSQVIRISTSIIKDPMKKTAVVAKAETETVSKSVAEKKIVEVLKKPKPKPIPKPVPKPVQKPEPAPAVINSEPVDEYIEDDVAPIAAEEEVSEPVTSGVTTGEEVSEEPASGNAQEPTEAEVKASYIHANLKAVQQKISEELVYPMIARRSGWQGRVSVAFLLKQNGNVSNIKVMNSSGYELLDKQAVKALISAAPFPSPSMDINLIFPVTFSLR